MEPFGNQTQSNLIKGFGSINMGNETEWCPVRFVIIQVLTVIVSSQVQTGLDDTKPCYQLIITITISENKWL